MKTSIEQLAIFGGPKTFQSQLHVGRPNIGNRNDFISRTNEIIDRNWLTNNGPVVQEFESRIAEMLGVRHCIAMCNGTVALEIAIKGLGLQGEVIIPSFTFIATAHALQWQGITPIFCDIDPESFCIDPYRIEQHITSKTTGIMGVHIFGRACNNKKLSDISERYGLKLLFDASHAFGATSSGQFIGNFGNCEVFSFHATKFINTLEGGAIVTNDDELAAKFRLMKNFGFAGLDNVIYLGTNGKMNEISAAMGLTNLDKMDSFIDINFRNYKKYIECLKGNFAIKPILYDLSEKNNFQYMVIEFDEANVGITRDLLIEIFHAENILARRYFYPGCHVMVPYRSFSHYGNGQLFETEKLCKKIIVLPTGSSVGDEDIELICNILLFAIQNGPIISEQYTNNHDS